MLNGIVDNIEQCGRHNLEHVVRFLLCNVHFVANDPRSKSSALLICDYY